MSKKSKLFTNLFKDNGIKQTNVIKLLIIFVLGHLLFWQLFSSENAQENPIPTLQRPYLKDSLFVSLPIKLLGPLNKGKATRMGLKHESVDILIPEVFIHHVQWETPHSGMANIEIYPHDLKAILNTGRYGPFIAFPWNSQLLHQPKPKDNYEIHLD